MARILGVAEFAIQVIQHEGCGMEGNPTLDELLEDEVLQLLLGREGLSVDELRSMMNAEKARIFGATARGHDALADAVSLPSP